MVPQQHIRSVNLQHIPKNPALALYAGKISLSCHGELLPLLQALRLRHADTGKIGKIDGKLLAQHQVIVRVLDKIPVGQNHRSTPLRKIPELALEVRLGNDHLRQDHYLIAGKVTVRRDHIHRDIAVIEEFMVFLHLGFAVQQHTLALDAKCRQGVVVVHDGHLTGDGGLQLRRILPNVPEEALHLIEFPALDIVRI